jgi:predicted dehydrogenase
MKEAINMNKVRIGIIGLGDMGSKHAKNIAEGKIKNLELTAVCDADAGRRDWASVNLGEVRLYADYKELITSHKIDAVLIAAPHYKHCEIAIFAFENGLNVLTEKPAGVFTKQVEAMNDAARKAGTVFGIMYNQRTSPIYKKVHEMVKAGRIGEPKRLIWIITNWYRTQAYYNSGTWRATWAGEGGGVLINQCPHNLDLWQWIFGMPKKIRGFCSYGKYHNVEVEDDVTVYSEYENGATGVFVTTTGEYPGTNRLEISGDKGKIVVEDNKLKFWELQTPEREFCFSAEKGSDEPEVKFSEIVTEGAETAHNGILQNFTDCILYGEELIAPGEEGINGLTLSNAIYLSDWTNDIVQLPIDKELYLKKLNEKIESSEKKDEEKLVIADIQGTYNSQWDI